MGRKSPAHIKKMKIMKPNKKQIEANLRNKLASQYTQKINLLKERVSSLISINLEYRTEVNTLKRENFELKDKIQQYEDWIERLHEFMSMNESDRQAYIDNLHKQKQLDQALDKINLYTSLFQKIFN